jgi:hypothetical protein
MSGDCGERGIGEPVTEKLPTPELLLELVR